MRAIQVNEFGGPEVLRPADLPAPEAGPGEVLIDVEAADVIYLDTMLRQGWGGEYFPVEPPYVPGGGGAGWVVAVGEGVDPGWVGRRVAARCSAGYAEKVVTTVEDIVAVPGGVGSAEAAALVHDGVTALVLLRAGAIARGERVLVAAAAGGAGSLVVQLAHDAGAQLVAAARGDGKLALARELGARHGADYSEPGWPDRVRASLGGRGVDVAFDGAGGPLGLQVFETVADGGRFVTYGTSDGFTEIDPDVARRRRIRVTNALEGMPGKAEVRELLSTALDLVAQGRIRPVIGATFPLERAADAHASLAERTTVGKSLLFV
ncbi:zinc-binding dehydrogenase [Georgenia alba]|uniref:Zinc-binding dehydrogenase n=1 Tax=Georgenia alba TaxID=2233858 RepID=A0ABW2Q565_9MICO